MSGLPPSMNNNTLQRLQPILPITTMVHQASVSVIPYVEFEESQVVATGMRCMEFDGITDEETSPMRGISGMVLCRTMCGTVVVVDILRVLRRNCDNPVQPELWYLPSNHPWRFPVVDPSRATLIARATVQATKNFPSHDGHFFIDDFDDRVVEMQNNRHRAFLVVHWVGFDYDTRVSFNISGHIYYNKEYQILTPSPTISAPQPAEGDA